MHRYTFFALVLLALAACHPRTGTASQAASIGDPCTATDAGVFGCDDVNGGCVDDAGMYVDEDHPGSGVCLGGCSDPCTMHEESFLGGDCAPGFACTACDPSPGPFGNGPAECACACDENNENCTDCRPFVCMPLSDACHAVSCEPAECAGLPVCGG